MAGSTTRVDIVDPAVTNDDPPMDAPTHRTLLNVLPWVSIGTQTEGSWDWPQPDPKQHVKCRGASFAQAPTSKWVVVCPRKVFRGGDPIIHMQHIVP